MYLHEFKKRRVNCIEKKQGKALNNKGFTLFELMIVIALISILLGVAVVGISGYFETAEQLERSEIAETSFYSIQSYVNYLERHGELDEFEQQIKTYNQSVYGQENILSEAQNRSIIELNYEGGNAADFYENEYYPEHKESEIIYIPLDKDKANKVNNPLYPVLEAALENKPAMANSFLVEYDLSTGVVRGVFYSEQASNLTYHFGGEATEGTDCVYRDAGNLSAKKQGYYGLTFTSAEVELREQELLVPAEVKLVNEDRLYLTWAEENTNNQSFINGTSQYEELLYIVTLYDQDDNAIAMYELPRADMYEVTTGTEASILNYVDDYADSVDDILVGSTKTTRVSFGDLSYEEAPTGIAGEYYYMLLECLDHSFLDNGYEFDPEDRIYATVEVAYGMDGTNKADEIVNSNEESVFYAHVEDESGTQEFGVACNRHLWNIRNGYYDGDYRLIADVDWTNIEGRARNFTFSSTQFADKDVPGTYHSFEGSFTGEKTGEAAESGDYRYSCYAIHGITVNEEGNEQVGLFTVNRGTINDIVLSDFTIKGALKAGAMAGSNLGTIQDVCVLNVSAQGTEQIGGLVGYNEGIIEGCSVTTGTNRILAQHTVGGVAGYSKKNITDTRAACQVETVIPAGTEKISTSTLGRYAGGVIGYVENGAQASKLYSGLWLDKANGMPLSDAWENGTGSATIEGEEICSNVTGISYLGGVIGEIEAGAGEFAQLYNYAKLHVIYLDEEERTARSDFATRLYQYYGGVTSRLYAGNSLKECVNYAAVDLDFVKDGQVCDAVEIYGYISKHPANDYYWNCPRYIGGITGYNQGKVQDCTSLCDEYGTFEEELAGYQKVYNQEEGCYVGIYVGGLIGYNEAELLFTDALVEDTMQVVVRAYALSNGGMVGYAKSGSIRNEGDALTIQGVVATRGSANPQAHRQIACTGGVAGSIIGDEITGAYINDSYIMGKNAGGITGYLGKNLSLNDCKNTGIIYGRGLPTTGTRGAVAGIAGYNYGTLTECSNTGTVSNSPLMDQVSDTSDEAANYNYTGGVAGYNLGTVKNCHSKLNDEKDNYIVGLTTSNVGGIVGFNSYNGSSALGVVLTDTEEIVDIPIIIGASVYKNNPARVGGIIGTASGELELKDFTYEGYIDGRETLTQAQIGFGGIIGSLSNAQSLSNCTMKGKITSKTVNVGGITGYMTGGIIVDTNEVTEEVYIEGGTYTGGVVGYHNVASTVNSRIDIMENKAIVKGKNYAGGIAGFVANGDMLDISERKNYGKVSGVQYVGGVAGAYVAKSQLSFSGCRNYGEIQGKTEVGGITGHFSSKDGTIVYTITDFVNEGLIQANVTGANSVGGIIGYNNIHSIITECQNKGTIDVVDETYTMSNLGGVIGYNVGVMKMTDCNNEGTITGTNYVGGIVGDSIADVSMVRCINDAAVTGKTYVAGLLGYANFSNGEKMEFADCTNKEEGKILATNHTVGGILGYLGPNATLSVKMTNCQNYGELDSAKYVGGVLGHSIQAHIELENCHNYGEIGKNSADRWKINTSGGLVGYALGNEDFEESIIRNCTQNADIYEIGGSSVGGFVGSSNLPLLIENCSSGTVSESLSIDCVAYSTNVAGMVGYSSQNLRLKKCTANVDITGAVAGDDIGGLIGKATSVTIGEESNPDSYCYNYGDILLAGLIRYTGGFVGYVQASDFEVYGGANYGIIGSNATQVQRAGGLIGVVQLEYTKQATGIVKDFTQLGQIYHGAIGIGGLIGLNQYHSLTLYNCHNGLASNENSGNIYVTAANAAYVGGLIGCCEGTGKVEGVSRKLSIQSSHNYGDICIENTAGTARAVGGLVGASTHNTYIGIDGDASVACHNYGEIYGKGTARINHLGGILGEAKSALGSESYIYASVNNRDLGRDLTATVNSGGIVGSFTQNGVIKDCTNLGKLCNVNKYATLNIGNGGILGYASTTELLVQNCINGSQAKEEAGRLIAQNTSDLIGGIVGSLTIKGTKEEAYVRIKDCINYANIQLGVTNYVGGICGNKNNTGMLYIENSHNRGTITSSGATAGYVGGILGHGNGANVQIGASLEDGSTNTDLVCVNYGELRFENGCNASYIGGILGRGDSVSLYGARNEADIVPDDKKSSVSIAGGIAGCVIGTSHFQDVNQLGDMFHAVFNGNGSSTGAGGLVGRLIGTTTILRCVNGTPEASGVKNIIQADKFGTNQIPVAFGGLIGRSSATLDIQDSVNYADIYINAENGNYIGGICGSSSGNEKYLSTQNYGDIIAEGKLDYAGGMIGMLSTWQGSAANITILGSATDAAKACVNYGDILFDGAEISYRLAGMIGGAQRSCEIYSATNYGNIGKEDSTGRAYNSGGMVGQITANYSGRIVDCMQKGVIRRAYYNIGGMMGLLEGSAQVTNCVNGSVDDAEVGSIHGVNGAYGHGGIVGNAKNLNIQECVNYADIVSEGTIQYGGGLVGLGNSKIIIGSESGDNGQCINYGDIYANGREIYVGGILGNGAKTTEVYHCINKGNIALGENGGQYFGGIVGNMGSTGGVADVENKIADCVNDGHVLFGETQVEGSSYAGAGGIVGRYYAGIEPTEENGIFRCTNNGQVAWLGITDGSGSSFGGIAGSGSGRIANCTNLGKVYGVTNYTGGIAGSIAEQTTLCVISECVNGAADVADAGAVSVTNKANYVAGIVGYTRVHSYDKLIKVIDCINYADITTTEGQSNMYVAGIMGAFWDSSGKTSNMEILRCKNYGDISGSHMYGAGIIATTTSVSDYIISDCINYGNISATDRLKDKGLWQQYGRFAGIAGEIGGYGGIINCVNMGNICGEAQKTCCVGGIGGYISSGYIVNCYNLGTVASDTNYYTGDLAGYVSGVGYIIDCYSAKNTVGKLFGVVNNIATVATEHTLWQASNVNGNTDYYDQTSYESLCNVFGIEPTWSENQLTNVLYLTANYKLMPSAPTADNFVYTPSSVDEETGEIINPATITWALTTRDYFAASGMEVALYDSTMTDEEILADTEGSNAFYHTTIDFITGKTPTTVTLPFDDALLPEMETTYKVVIKTLGYSTTEGTVITEDTDRAIQSATLTLPGTLAEDTEGLSTSGVSAGDFGSPVERRPVSEDDGDETDKPTEEPEGDRKESDKELTVSDNDMSVENKASTVYDAGSDTQEKNSVSYDDDAGGQEKTSTVSGNDTGEGDEK